MDFGGFGFGFDFDTVEGSASETSGNSGFEDWGQALENFFDTPTKKVEKSSKASEKKGDVKKTGAKADKKKGNGKDDDVTLPVTIRARGFKTTIDGFGKMKLSEIGKKLIEDGYNQFLIPGMGLVYHESVGTVYVTDGAGTAAASNTAIDLSDGKTITVIDGQLSATFSADDFADKEVDEITASDVAERFALINPNYAGCGVSYTEGNGYFYPVFSSYELTRVNVPVTIMLDGDMSELEDEGVADVKALTKMVYGELPNGLVANLAKTAREGVYATCYCSFSAYCITEIAAASNSNPSNPKKVEQKYELPLELYVVTFNCLYNLTPEDFDGAKKVTLEQIKNFMADKQKMFSDKSRKLDTLYNKEMNRLAVMFVSGSKGCELIRTEEELGQCRKKEQFHGFFVGKQGVVKLLALPHGNFFTLMGKEELCTTVMGIAFERKLPKIPSEIFYSIVEYFREDLGKEAMVRIVYNKECGEFSFYKAGGRRSKARLDYEFEVDESLFCPNMVQVMEIHSHNTMPAFFSVVDDQDESGYPGVFGVIGNLDCQSPSMKFRAGVSGIFKELDCLDLFEEL